MTQSRMAVELLDMFGPALIQFLVVSITYSSCKVDLVAKYVMLTSFWNFSWLKASFFGKYIDHQ